MSKYFEVVAVSDDNDTCECCGKTGLKRVVYIRNNETGEVKHFGTTCAASPVKGFGVDKEIKQAINRFSDKQKALNYLSHHAYKAAGGSYVANPDGTSWSVADSVLYQTVRAGIEARGFNY